MIKATTYWSFPNGLENTADMASVLKEARECGFDAIELCIAPTGVLTTDTSEQECHKIRSLIDASGLRAETLASGMSWGKNPASDDPAEREEAIALHEAALRRAGWLGLDALLFVPGVANSAICPDVSIRYDLAFERAREAVTRLLVVAEEVGVDLLIENVWNGLFYSPIEFAVFIDSFQNDRLGIYFDVGNVLGYHQNPAHWIEILAHRIRRVHIKDFKKSLGTLDGFCDLLEGDVDFPAVMNALHSLGYEKTIVAEMIPWNEGLLERTSQAMDKILQMGSEQS